MNLVVYDKVSTRIASMVMMMIEVGNRKKHWNEEFNNLKFALSLCYMNCCVKELASLHLVSLRSKDNNEARDVCEIKLAQIFISVR